MVVKILIFLIGFLFAQNPSIVFVYIGEKIPDFAEFSIKQAHEFNKNLDIYFVGNEKAKINFELPQYVTYVPAESLKRSSEHTKFLRKSKLDRKFWDGFWIYNTERFFYFQECMHDYKLKNSVYLECDVMLYENLEKLMPLFKQHYSDLGAEFDSYNRCLAGFMYSSNDKALLKLLRFLEKDARKGKSDMETLNLFREKVGSKIMGPLPIIMDEYIKDHKEIVVKENIFSKNFKEFNSIFDAAALGQYLGGIDPRNGESKPGFINETCVFDPSKLDIRWERDYEGRRVPFAYYKDKGYRINNLHIHSKNLKPFLSK